MEEFNGKAYRMIMNQSYTPAVDLDSKTKLTMKQMEVLSS
jgi:hypothetical protein